MKIISGNSNVDLAKAIVGFLGTKLIDALVSRFSDGEIRLEINENVRERNVFAIQSTCQPVNDNRYSNSNTCFLLLSYFLTIGKYSEAKRKG